MQIVQDYTRRVLTYPEKDKLVAIAAIAQQFATVLGEDYYAGHFRKNMPADLAWAVKRGSKPRSPTKRRCPTWSWASVDNELVYEWDNLGSRRTRDLAEVEGVRSSLKNPSYKFGQVEI
ncbi:hypothetical protein VP1G_11191 [Cytospora mali]|uniref:Uncharacterized protein n=1 Tax=Cytospora mali TaxID=578113 RepID=A0A194VA39_CYTMA|nr:hypothetical protein VP1G_11191 [Valsa mali var. pyri (nom. inval.)]